MYITNLPFEGCVVLFTLSFSEGVVFVFYRSMKLMIQRHESKAGVFFVT